MENKGVAKGGRLRVQPSASKFPRQIFGADKTITHVINTLQLPLEPPTDIFFLAMPLMESHSQTRAAVYITF
jgi:hypothetical protein